MPARLGASLLAGLSRSSRHPGSTRTRSHTRSKPCSCVLGEGLLLRTLSTGSHPRSTQPPRAGWIPNDPGGPGNPNGTSAGLAVHRTSRQSPFSRPLSNCRNGSAHPPLPRAKRIQPGLCVETGRGLRPSPHAGKRPRTLRPCPGAHVRWVGQQEKTPTQEKARDGLDRAVCAPPKHSSL